MHFPRLRSRRPRRPNERGAVLVVAAVAVVMAVAAASLGVDVGRIAIDKKTDQNVADLAALDAARALGLILNTTNMAGYDAAAQTAASSSAARNGFTANGTTFTVTAQTGSVNASNAFVHDASAGAVQVVVTSRLKYQFLPGQRDISATAVAMVGSPIAAFSVGSTLVSLDTSKGSLDPVLKSMLGASGSLSAVSYDGLASGNVKLGDLQTALLAAGFNVGTVSQLLNTDLKVRDLLTATASALGTSIAKTEINDLLAASINSTATITLGQLLNVATPSDSAVLASKFNVYQLVTGAAELMNGSNFASIGTGLALPGGSTLDASVKVISPAQTAIGPVGTTAANSQVVVNATLHVRAGLLGSLVDVGLTYTMGQAQGTLTSIVCGASPSIGVSATTAATTVTATGSTAITGTLTLSPTSIGGSGPTPLSFGYNTTTGAWSPSQTQRVPNATSGIGSTTIGVAGSGNVLLNLILAVLNPLANVISTAITGAVAALTPALKALGVDVGAADVTALGIFPDPTSCGGHPRLAR